MTHERYYKSFTGQVAKIKSVNSQFKSELTNVNRKRQRFEAFLKSFCKYRNIYFRLQGKLVFIAIVQSMLK